MNNPEHIKVRIPTLNAMLSMGWDRSKIICPSPDSEDIEWRVPKRPSEASRREGNKSFDGYPVDMAIFDAPENVAFWDHIEGIGEFKAPNIETGISQLETYLGLEPHARFGFWTNGNSTATVYKLPDGTFEIEKNTGLPKPDASYIRAGHDPITYSKLTTPSETDLSNIFSKLLGVIAANDSVSTRPEQRLNEIANLLIVKMESDTVALMGPDDPVDFQLSDSPGHTAAKINALFKGYKGSHTELFFKEDQDFISLSNDSIQHAVLELQSINLKAVAPRALSMAFQVFRAHNLKIGDGQYFTHHRVVEAGIKLLDITPRDKVIDPACGTGGFLDFAYTAICDNCNGDPKRLAEARTWAHRNLYGVDRDSINVKLTRALMVGDGDGSTNIYLGDSIRSHRWASEFPKLAEALADESFSVVVTNPPFGKDLRVSSRDCRAGNYTISKHAPGGKPSSNFSDTELGIAFVERAWRLLKPGGRLGIVLPETYFFSKSYEWFRLWLGGHFVLKGVLNIPMEAFQGFCRAKTNFYVFTKVGDPDPNIHTPSWFRSDSVWVSNAPTIGINKDGLDLFKVDASGKRTNEIDNSALSEIYALLTFRPQCFSSYLHLRENSFIGVPKYSDKSSIYAFREFLASKYPAFSPVSLGDLVSKGYLSVRIGHGSPSSDLRNGTVPYIKVSDLRAGLVNINSTNMVPKPVAEKFWHGSTSGLRPYCVITPSRACKNIGEPVVLMPDQTDVVLTKEVLVFASTDEAPFDDFYLAWALDLPSVLAQWNRIIFMQTNREDVGMRYLEIEIPFPSSAEDALAASSSYRHYYTELSRLRDEFIAARGY